LNHFVFYPAGDFSSSFTKELVAFIRKILKYASALSKVGLNFSENRLTDIGEIQNEIHAEFLVDHLSSF